MDESKNGRVRIPVWVFGLVGFLLAQFIGFIWWVAVQGNRIDEVRGDVSAIQMEQLRRQVYIDEFNQVKSVVRSNDRRLDVIERKINHER